LKFEGFLAEVQICTITQRKVCFCRRLQHEIERLKSKNTELERQNLAMDCCSETDTDGDDHLSDCRSNASCSQEINKSGSAGSKSLAGAEGLNDNLPLISLLRSHKNSPRTKSTQEEMHNISTWPTEASPKCFSKTASDQQTVLSRKRIRIVLSDDEDEMHDKVDCPRERLNRCPPEDVATSNGCGFNFFFLIRNDELIYDLKFHFY
jgi:hypothetical protein